MVTAKGTVRVSPNFWKTLVPENLLALPRVKGVIKDIMMDPNLILNFEPSYTLASKVLAHANEVIKAIPNNCLFKIGQTSHPAHRWNNEGYGYKHYSDPWTLLPIWCNMRILGILAYGESAGFMEAALIAAWCSHPCCANDASGGEAVCKTDGPFFVYIVVSHPR